MVYSLKYHTYLYSINTIKICYFHVINASFILNSEGKNMNKFMNFNVSLMGCELSQPYLLGLIIIHYFKKNSNRSIIIVWFHTYGLKFTILPSNCVSKMSPIVYLITSDWHFYVCCLFLNCVYWIQLVSFRLICC